MRKTIIAPDDNKLPPLPPPDMREMTVRFQRQANLYLLLQEKNRELATEVSRLDYQLEGVVRALRELVRLKDGPRDDAYRDAKDAAWDTARAVLDACGGR